MSTGPVIGLIHPILLAMMSPVPLGDRLIGIATIVANQPAHSRRNIGSCRDHLPPASRNAFCNLSSSDDDMQM
jgi:hypothetical protein